MEDTAMTKKNYIQPTIQVVKIKTAGMLALSNVSGYDGGYDPDGGDPDEAG